MPLHQLFQFEGTVENLHPDDPLRQVGEDNGAMFTYLVDVLRSPQSFPDEKINKLMTLTWRLVGNRVIPAAVMGGIPSLHFYFEKMGGQTPFGMFACPMDWAKQCVQRRVFCMGGLVWASSMARDAYNGRFEFGLPDVARNREEVANIHHRAKAYESQFLHVMGQTERFKPDEYQRKVMEAYPGGVGDVSRLLYEGRRFMDAS